MRSLSSPHRRSCLYIKREKSIRSEYLEGTRQEVAEEGLSAIAVARGQRIRDALIANGQISTERVELARSDSDTDERAGLVRLKLVISE